MVNNFSLYNPLALIIPVSRSVAAFSFAFAFPFVTQLTLVMNFPDALLTSCANPV